MSKLHLREINSIAFSVLCSALGHLGFGHFVRWVDFVIINHDTLTPAVIQRHYPHYSKLSSTSTSLCGLRGKSATGMRYDASLAITYGTHREEKEAQLVSVTAEVHIFPDGDHEKSKDLSFIYSHEDGFALVDESLEWCIYDDEEEEDT